MKRKFLSISCCFFLSLSLMCCSQVKSSLDGNDTSIITSASDNTSISSQDETLINDALSVDESTLQDNEATTNVSTSTISENPKENTNTSLAIEKNTTVENLSSTEDSSYSSQTCRLFFYNSVDGRRYYVDENIHVEENALVSALTSALQDNKYSSDFILLSNQIGVSSATVDAANNALTVKFNDSFEKYMNLDPASSYELIYTLINTYAYNYKVNKVSLYFNNLQYTAAPSADENGWYAPYFDSSISYNKN